MSNVTNAGPRAKCDQVIFEALCKACEVIVGSRTNLNSSGGSSRFNLQIPEVAGVRSILSQYRLQLHVPVRLDVYHQQGDRRDLLERWCLEYRPVSSEQFLQAEGIVTNDPMVQLTHVCKRIVIWLRTLYCWARLLPSQSVGLNISNDSKIGFSIYVHSNGKDDIAELTSNQGFLRQQPSRGGSNGVVTTPYGELGWHVVFCPPSKLERLVPKTRTVRIQTTSRPIPMKTRQKTPPGTAAHSAPTRDLTYTERSQQKLLEVQQQHRHALTHGKSFDPSSTFGRHVVQRRNTTNWIPEHHKKTPEEAPPTRVLSGLSLALMMAGNDDEVEAHGDDNSPLNGDDLVVVDDDDDDDDEETEEVRARRAALHEVPAHLLEQPGAAASGEYGYGYNNHIPWQKLQHSTESPVTSPALRPTPPPTPPTAAFLGATPPKFNAGLLIPPRARSDSGGTIAPPFPTRPLGFLQEAPSIEPPRTVATEESREKKQKAAVPSLDSLRSSPFQQQQQLSLHPDSRASMLSSFSHDYSSHMLTSSSDFRKSMLNVGSSGAVLPSSLHGAGQHAFFQSEEDFYSEDMPFAVDLPTAPNKAAKSVNLGNSTSLASLAQKCAQGHRLKLFEKLESAEERAPSAAAAPQNDVVDSLANQLQDFRTFGASLLVSGPRSSGDQSGTSSTSTPISLRS